MVGIATSLVVLAVATTAGFVAAWAVTGAAPGLAWAGAVALAVLGAVRVTTDGWPTAPA